MPAGVEPALPEVKELPAEEDAALDPVLEDEAVETPPVRDAFPVMDFPPRACPLWRPESCGAISTEKRSAPTTPEIRTDCSKSPTVTAAVRTVAG